MASLTVGRDHNRKKLSLMSKADLVKLSEQTNNKKHAHKARKELAHRGLSA